MLPLPTYFPIFLSTHPSNQFHTNAGSDNHVETLVTEKHSGLADIQWRQSGENTTDGNFFLTAQYNKKGQGNSFILTFLTDLINKVNPTGSGTKCLNYFVHFNLSVNCTGCGEYLLLGYDAVKSVELYPTFRRNVSPPSSGSKNSRVQLYGLHGVTSQKKILFKTTAVKTSNPTFTGCGFLSSSLQKL
jgi:hypothetical protein